MSSDCDGKDFYAYDFVIEENLEDTKDFECAVVVVDDMLDIVKKIFDPFAVGGNYEDPQVNCLEPL